MSKLVNEAVNMAVRRSVSRATCLDHRKYAELKCELFSVWIAIMTGCATTELNNNKGGNSDQ